MKFSHTLIRAKVLFEYILCFILTSLSPRLQQTISMLEESKLRHSSQFDAIREQLEEAELHASNLQHQLDVNLAQLK